MLSFKHLSAIAALSAAAVAQNVTVPSTCTEGFSSGTNVVLHKLPYTYDQVISIIGSYKNLTCDTVSLNGSDNTVGTARSYDLAGAHLVETLELYSKPSAPGPYEEVHTTALLTLPSAGNISVYILYDGQVLSSICGGKATLFSLTTEFCADNVTATDAVLTQLHLGDAVTAGEFLGGTNFTTCEALSGGNGTTGNGSNTSNVSGNSQPTPGAYEGGSRRTVVASMAGAVVAMGAIMLTL